MKQFESEHYHFYYRESTTAERNILQIAEEQEACFQYICQVLRTVPDFKINYYLCDSPEEVGRVYGDNEPCNGFASPPDTVYAVYNEKVKCVGFHEDAHLISYSINRPASSAVREGLAMYFDRAWWGIDNREWTVFFFKTGQSLSIGTLLDQEFFFSKSDAVTYPIMGAFTDWLIASFGVDAYLRFYRHMDSAEGMRNVYQKTPEELNAAFWAYIGMFSIDSVLEKRIEELLRQ